MRTSQLACLIFTFIISMVLLCMPFSVHEARSQRPTQVPIRPVEPIRVPPTIKPPIVSTPSVPRVDLPPSIEPIHPPNPDVVRRPEPQPSVVVTPVVENRIKAIVAGSGPEIKRENPDCSVHQFTCAESCDPLSSQWSSYRECVNYYCKQVDESCLDALTNELESRGDVTFNIECQSQYKIQLAFYSQDRNVAWPGNSRVYAINDYKTHQYKLRCNSGEKICYGAWVVGGGEYWGSGMNDRHACESCCRRCNGNSVSYVLQ